MNDDDIDEAITFAQIVEPQHADWYAQIGEASKNHDIREFLKLGIDIMPVHELAIMLEVAFALMVSVYGGLPPNFVEGELGGGL